MKPLGLAETAGRIAIGFQVYFARMNALKRFGDTRNDFLESFWCAALIFFPFLWLVWLSPAAPDIFDDVPSGRRLSVYVISYAIGWVYWPLIMAYVAGLLGKRDQWVRYVVAINWTEVPPFVMYLITITLIGEAAPALARGAELGLIAWWFVVHGSILRTLFGTSPAVTMALVIGNFILDLLLFKIEVSLLLGG